MISSNIIYWRADLARHDDISSTEKLLDLIRGKNDTASDSTSIAPRQSTTSSLKNSLIQAFPLKKKIVVGVDIGGGELKMVKIGQALDRKQEMLGYSSLPFESDMSIDNPQFSIFLQSALNDFCGDLKNVEIWSAISSANVTTRYLRIPLVTKKQIANAVYWTFKKEVSFNENKEIFDFNILGEIAEDGDEKIEIMSYAAPKREISQLKHIFSKSGYPLTGISIVPFALQNLVRSQWIETEGENTCTLFIGSDWSRIAIFSKGNLVLSRDIKAGIRSMIASISEKADNGLPEQSVVTDDTDGTATMGVNLEDTTNIDEEQAQRLFFTITHDSLTLIDAESGLKYKADDIFKMILPALERVIRQVERTIKHFSLNYKDGGVNKIFISGEVSGNRRIVDYIGDQLSLNVDTIDLFTSNPFLSSDVSVPDSELERGAFVPAVGMALSNNFTTPNFIFTHEEKEKHKKFLLINRSFITAFLLLLALCIGVSYWQSDKLDRKRATLSQLQQELEQHSPILDQNLIIKMVAKVQRKTDTLDSISKRYLGMAVISEISELTPSNISLFSIIAEFGRPVAYNQEEKESKDKNKLLNIEGVIFGDRMKLETSLADYIVKLKNSPIFGRPVIKKRSFKFFEDKEVLQFTVQLDLI
jgi:Tfp pilus assembly PilM family ATPase